MATRKSKSGKQSGGKFRVALICGGPSLERGISLNSARSVCDHLINANIEICPLYFDFRKNAYLISRAQLYCNTPSDFDFKLKSSAKPLSSNQLIRFLKTVDLAFPAMHGPFGEDGGIQKILSENGVPYVGSPEAACRLAFDKFYANEFIRKNGFYTLPSMALERGGRDHKQRIAEFFRTHRLKRAIVKPATGGSSIAVYSVSSVEEALQATKEIMSKRVDGRVVIEPFCEGTEFTVIILENRFGLPVAILPTEIELDYHDHQIFDYRKKYLATRQVTYHCPPRFSNEQIEKIQIHAEQLFKLFGMRDFGRFDGWIMKDGNIWFSDFNLVSGMEQNSFLFMQASRLGMSHRDLLRYVVKNACRREGLTLPPDEELPRRGRKPLSVLFGGGTAERQVSLMSGTNVWLKLRRSRKFIPDPYLLDAKGYVWRLPYAFALNHTVEEISDMCLSAQQDDARLAKLRGDVLDRLSPLPGEVNEPWFLPERMTLEKFISNTENLFIGLHGGIGENGELQKILERRQIPFNGPGSKAAKLCMDKYATGLALKDLASQGIHTAGKTLAVLGDFKKFTPRDYAQYWTSLTEALGSPTVIVKPVDDGCSAGIARLFSAQDLRTYVRFALRSLTAIPQGCLTNQHGIIEMPTVKMRRVLFEEFVETDKVRAINNKLLWRRVSDWIEITVGVIERGGKIVALNPSVTVATGNVLSLEEKFQGGTGVNITPPPESHVPPLVVQRAKRRIETVARTLGLQGYARIDAFLNIKTGEIIVIEANSLPGLTPATVIYHQALAEKPPRFPLEFLEEIFEAAIRRYSKRSRGISKNSGLLRVVK